jgi:hypothetical protein
VLVVVVIGGLGSVPARSSPRSSSRSSTPSASCPAENLDRPGVPGDGAGAGRAAVGPARAPRRSPAPRAACRSRAGARWRARAAFRRWLGSLAARLPLVAGPYFVGVASEVLIFMLYAASLHFSGRRRRPRLVRPRRLFRPRRLRRGVGAETARPRHGGRARLRAAAGLRGALLFGWFCVRLTGVYFAMLTLAFAQIAWSLAFQWTDVTGGDNGIVGVWPSAWAATPARFYWLTLARLRPGDRGSCA